MCANGRQGLFGRVRLQRKNVYQLDSLALTGNASLA